MATYRVKNVSGTPVYPRERIVMLPKLNRQMTPHTSLVLSEDLLKIAFSGLRASMVEGSVKIARIGERKDVPINLAEVTDIVNGEIFPPPVTYPPKKKEVKVDKPEVKNAEEVKNVESDKPIITETSITTPVESAAATAVPTSAPVESAAAVPTSASSDMADASVAEKVSAAESESSTNDASKGTSGEGSNRPTQAAAPVVIAIPKNLQPQLKPRPKLNLNKLRKKG
jgi:hypothetical protein